MLEAGRPRTHARGGAAPRLEHRLERRLEHTGAQTGAQTRAKCRSERARGAGRGRVCAELGEAVYARSWAGPRVRARAVPCMRAGRGRVCAPGLESLFFYDIRGFSMFFCFFDVFPTPGLQYWVLTHELKPSHLCDSRSMGPWTYGPPTVSGRQHGSICP